MCLKKFSREVHTPCFKFLSLLVQRFPNKTSEPIRSITAPLSVVSVVRIWGPNRLHSRTIVVPASSPNYDRISVESELIRSRDRARIGPDSEVRFVPDHGFDSASIEPKFGPNLRSESAPPPDHCGTRIVTELRIGADSDLIRKRFKAKSRTDSRADLAPNR